MRTPGGGDFYFVVSRARAVMAGRARPHARSAMTLEIGVARNGPRAVARGRFSTVRRRRAREKIDASAFARRVRAAAGRGPRRGGSFLGSECDRRGGGEPNRANREGGDSRTGGSPGRFRPTHRDQFRPLGRRLRWAGPWAYLAAVRYPDAGVAQGLAGVLCSDAGVAQG